MTNEATPTVPRGEILDRAARLWRHLGTRPLAAVFAVERVEILYFAGTPQDGLVWIPRDGEPIFFVRRDLARARAESPLGRIIPFTRARDIPEILAREGAPVAGPVGTSLDILPVSLYQSLSRALGVPVEDASAEIRMTRAAKSAWERAHVRAAGALATEIFTHLQTFIRPGMREIDVAAEVDAELVRAESVSYYRTRTFNLQFTGVCCLAGESGNFRGASDSPNSAGRGPSPAFGQGASARRFAPGEPILVDFAVNRGGYYVDTTRMFHFGELPARFVAAHRLSEEILAAAAEALAAGRPPEEVYASALARAAGAGLGDVFMGGSRFLGHGVGLQIDEWPVIADGFDRPLPEGAVVALEPKFALPGGIVGVETTFVFEGGKMVPTVALPTALVRLD
jgi:Xaa-Pro dipeptidase